MTRETELIIQQQLTVIIKRLDEMECKIDKILVPELLQRHDSTTPTEESLVSESIQAKLTKALVRERAKAVAEMNEKL